MCARTSLALFVVLLACSCGSSTPHGGMPDVTDVADADLADALSDLPDRGAGDADSPGDDLPDGEAAPDSEGLADGPDGEADAAEPPRVLLGYASCNNSSTFPEPCPPPRYAVPALTHFVQGSFPLRGDGEFPSVDVVGCPCLVRAVHEVGARILLGFGDGGASDLLGDVVGNPVAEETAARTIASGMLELGYDGVEINCFSSGCIRSVAPLASQLRSALDALGPGHPLAVVLPLDPAGSTYSPAVPFDVIFELPALLASVDLFVLHIGRGTANDTYHCESEAPDHSGHATPLWTSTADPCYRTSRPASVSASVRAWLDRGVPRQKMLVPISFFGLQFLVSALYEPLPGRCYTTVGAYTRDPAWTSYFDTEAGVPYMVNVAAARLVSYEDEESIRLKCEFVRAEGLRGVAVFNVGYDRDATDATPLMDATLEACATEP